MWSSQEGTAEISTRSGLWSWRVQAVGSPSGETASGRTFWCHRGTPEAMMFRQLDPSLPDLTVDQAEALSHTPEGRMVRVDGVKVTVHALPRPPRATATDLSQPAGLPKILRVSVPGRRTARVDYDLDEALGDLTDDEFLGVVRASGLLDDS